MSGCCGPETMFHGFHHKMKDDCCEGEGGMHFEKIMRMAAEACGGGFERRYRTKEEKVSGLEEYLKDLETEAAAVREAIADLKPA
ncbi:MAG: hypothetical protein NT080_08935 [Spirochaetes bacterium]|nr:hypothetical protein [Spirochaetota bacterium]